MFQIASNYDIYNLKIPNVPAACKITFQDVL